MKYEVIRTDIADEGIRKIILYVAQNFGNTVALEKLNQIEKQILLQIEQLKEGGDSYICGCRWTSGLSEYYTWLIEIVDSY